MKVISFGWGVQSWTLAAMAALGEAASTSSATEPLPEWVTDGKPGAAVWVVADFNDEPSAPTDSSPAPAPAPPLHESAPQGETHAAGRADVLARLAQRLEGLREEMRQLGDEYGKVTGDFTTPLEIRHKIERMQVQVKANQGGWE